MTRLSVFIRGDISSDMCRRYIALYFLKISRIKEIDWYKYYRVHYAIKRYCKCSNICKVNCVIK